MTHSYDCIQRQAILVPCLTCAQWKYMTRAHLRCLRCRGLW